jgi:hypothetical protein
VQLAVARFNRSGIAAVVQPQARQAHALDELQALQQQQQQQLLQGTCGQKAVKQVLAAHQI